MNDALFTEKYENYLLVEGRDDKHVFYELLKQHQILKQFETKNQYFEVKDHEGIDNLLNSKTLKTYLKVDVDEPRRFGIVIDADTNLSGRWQKLRDILKSLGYDTMPDDPIPDGTIIKEDGLPNVGIWLMPDNKVPGVMEDFVGLLVPRDDLLWPLAGDVLQRVIERDRRFREAYQSKACLHTWLAWQKEPGTSLGLAITRHYVDITATHAQELIDWIRKLFDLGSA